MACVVQVRDDRGTVLAELVTIHDRYVLPDGSDMYVPTDVAWRRVCGAFTLVESLPSSGEMLRTAHEFHRRTHSDPVLKYLLAEAKQWAKALSVRVSLPRCLSCGGSKFVTLPDDGNSIVPP
jgi:hypothetical protein